MRIVRPVMQLGEGFAGEGVDAAHVNTVLGDRSGPVGAAWATALATPSAGHAPFVAVACPGVPVQPFTLFVNKAAISGDRHGGLTWGAAQAGIAAGIGEALLQGVIDRSSVGDLAVIAAVWVNPSASDESAVYENNRLAVGAALAAGAAGEPSVDRFLDAARAPWNPFYERRT
jgi:5,6,7,8-tetrahydromethanopterin hydro-lyase